MFKPSLFYDIRKRGSGAGGLPRTNPDQCPWPWVRVAAAMHPEAKRHTSRLTPSTPDATRHDAKTTPPPLTPGLARLQADQVGQDDAAGANPQYQLFNLKQDPNETSDLAQQYPGLVQFMDACLNSKTSASYGGTDAPGAPRSTPILALEES
jgi:hypothetical protein